LSKSFTVSLHFSDDPTPVQRNSTSIIICVQRPLILGDADFSPALGLLLGSKGPLLPDPH
jgi:hypothetical protein